MAAPATPNNYWLQQAAGQVYLLWDIASGATSYPIYRSVDSVTYTLLATATVNNYLDTTAVIGTMYYYKLKASNTDGDSQFTSPQSCVPTPSGEMCLSEIRQAAQQRADRLNSQFVTLPEWNSYINQSMFELYDLLVTTYEDYFIAEPVEFSTDGSTYRYPLPNGTNYDGADAFYKITGVDLGINTANNAWVTVDKFNFFNRNQFVYPNTNSTIYGVYNLRYRIVGTNIEFIPAPASGQPIRLWYIPRLTPLLQENQVTYAGISGWLEYVIVDAAIKALQKEESDVSVLMAQKAALKLRIEESAPNRDAGRPDTISDVRTQGRYGYGMGSGGFGGGGPF